MGVYINMEMPKDGSCIQIVIDDDGKVYPDIEKCIMKMGSIAKAVPVTPHGRLIDADALKNLYHYNTHDSDIDKAWTGNIRRSIDSAPTIIPAEEGE